MTCHKQYTAVQSRASGMLDAMHAVRFTHIQGATASVQEIIIPTAPTEHQQ
jgi:hypothetical protein